MASKSPLEKWSWIAGILSAAIALAAYFGLNWGHTEAPIPRPDASNHIQQQAGNNSTLIAENSGPIVINPPPAVEPVDWQGDWSQDRAVELSTPALNEQNWSEKFFNPQPPFTHKQAGLYHLLYRGGRETTLQAFETVPQDFECHACAPYLSFFEFEKRATGWKLIHKDVAAVRWGSMGSFSADEMQVLPIADSSYGVFFTGSYMAQGILETSKTVYTRVGDAFNQVFSIRLSVEGENEGAWESNFKIVPTPAGLYDFVVDRRGMGGKPLPKWGEGEEGKENVADYDNTIRPHDVFRFDGSRYRRSDVYQ